MVVGFYRPFPCVLIPTGGGGRAVAAGDSFRAASWERVPCPPRRAGRAPLIPSGGVASASFFPVSSSPSIACKWQRVGFPPQLE